jgi:hypothetical protein
MVADSLMRDIRWLNCILLSNEGDGFGMFSSSPINVYAKPSVVLAEDARFDAFGGESTRPAERPSI